MSTAVPAEPTPGQDPAPDQRHNLAPSVLPTLQSERWSRMHPVTPLVKGWGALVVGVVIIGQGLIEGPAWGADLSRFASIGVQLGVALAVAVVVVLGNVVAWFMTRYRIDREAVRLTSGVLSRTQRVARLDRLQAVDVVQPLIGRLFGLAELRIEVAGGSDSQVRLQYLRDSDAQRLRNALLAAAAGVEYETEDAPEAPERQVVHVPPGRLVAGTLLTGTVVVLGLGVVGLFVLVVVALVSDAVSLALVGAVLAGAVPGGVLVLAATAATGFARAFNFSLADSPDGLRVRAGLTETRSATIPPGRVQAVQISQSFLWRGPGWWHIKVNVAGYGLGAEADKQSSTVLLPVGDRRDVLAVLSLVAPGLDYDEVAAVDAGLTGTGAADGFVHAPHRARWLDPLAWRRNGYRSTHRVLLLRSGVLNRVLCVVPHERAQSIGLRQGPVQRRFRVATFALHSTPGPVRPVVPHLDEQVAAVLLHEEGVRGRAARSGAGPERWMRRSEPDRSGEGSAAGVGLQPGDESGVVADDDRGGREVRDGEELGQSHP